MKTSRKWWVQALIGALFIIFGIIAIRHPEDALLTLGLYIGYLSLINGALYIYSSISSRAHGHSGWLLAEGLLDVLFGLILVFNPGITIVLLPFILGFWVIFLGITQFAAGFALRKTLLGKQWLFYVLGIFSVVCGMVLMNKAVFTSLAITTLLGIFFLIYGVFLTVSSFGLKE